MSNTVKICGAIFVGTVSYGCRQVSAPEAITEIQSSHIKGNVPNPSEFNRLLQRDLTSYFVTRRGKDTQVNYEFLRDSPTQSGVSYPKYYLWVKVVKGGKFVEQGVVRVGAIEKQSYDITDYLSDSVLRKDIASAYAIFPAEVVEKIKVRLKR